jgi:hypothetical protein
MPSQGAQPQPNMAGERRETSFHINKKKMTWMAYIGKKLQSHGIEGIRQFVMANKGPKKIAMAPKELE